jgi:hypothetical protein
MSEHKEYRVRNSAGKTYAFTQWRQLSALAQHGKVDVDSELLLPGRTRWVAISTIPKVAELVISALIGEDEDKPVIVPPKRKSATAPRQIVAQAMKDTAPPRKKRTSVPKAAKARPAVKAALSRSRTRARRKPAPPAASREAAEVASPAPLKQTPALAPEPVKSAGSQPPVKSEEKPQAPALLALIPALLSIIPGLGQAYNLNIKKACFFCLLFLAALATAIFRPLWGLPVAAAVIFLAMSDAYATARGRGFFAGLWHGGFATLRLYFASVGVLLWAVVVLFVLDSTISWLGSGTQMASTISLDGSGAASREWSGLLVSAVAILGAVALFSLHAAGRRFVWARGKPSPVLCTVRTMCIATVCVGLFSILVAITETETGKQLAVGTLHLPVGVAVFDKFAALTGVGEAAATSMGEHAFACKFALLAGLAGLLPLIFFPLAKAMRAAPGFAEWLELWRTATRARTESLKAQAASLRADRAAVWQRRRALLEARHRQEIRASQMTDGRLARLEAMTEALALQASVEVPPALQPSPVAEGVGGEAPLSTIEKLGLIATAMGRFASKTCWPLLAGCVRSLASSTAAVGTKLGSKLKRKPRTVEPEPKAETQMENESQQQATSEVATEESIPQAGAAQPKEVDEPEPVEVDEEEAAPAAAALEEVPEAAEEDILEPEEVVDDEPVEVIDAVAAPVPDDSRDETRLVKPVS